MPRPQLADYHRNSGTGILISERILFGDNGTERQYHKCLDYQMPEAYEHYCALLTAVARLAGTHRCERLEASLTERFPVDMRAATVGEPVPLDADRLQQRLVQLASSLMSIPLSSLAMFAPDVIARLKDDVLRFVQHEKAVWSYLARDPNYVALCHWNANVDNAWFWRDAQGALHCGLMDWGCVSHMNMGMAIWGAMSGAETDLWNRHLDDLLHLFVMEVRRYGGPGLDPDELRTCTRLYAALMGGMWLLDVSALIRSRFGPSTDLCRTDPGIRDDESVCAPLQMMANFLNLWETQRFGDTFDAILAN